MVEVDQGEGSEERSSSLEEGCEGKVDDVE
jgi:hypothetical protein